MHTNHDSNILVNTLNVTNTRKNKMNTFTRYYNYHVWIQISCKIPYTNILVYKSLKNLMITSRHVLKLEAGQKNK